MEKTKVRVCFNDKYKSEQYKMFLSKINIAIESKKRFQHWIDTGFYFYNKEQFNDACSPDYSLIIKNSLFDLSKQNDGFDNRIMKQNNKLIDYVCGYCNRVIGEIARKIEDYPEEKYLPITKQYFTNMLDAPARTLEEGLQRILFWSSLFWQTGHRLIGLGRLDLILQDLELPDDEQELINILTDFLEELHNYYPYKSSSILGDTGQLIILGGKTEDGDYFSNRITYAFVRAMIQCKLPDPKLLLRVSENMPDALLELAIKCIATGIGGPLLANDEVIIPSLCDFGYEYADACNYITSACWEPFAFGKAWGRGNLGDINYAKIFVDTYTDSRFEECKTFNEILVLFKEKLAEEISEIFKGLNTLRWEWDPLMTLFTGGCIQKNLDASEGGVQYCDYGILTVGLANTVDSLMNIKSLIFEEKRITLAELKNVALTNYEGQGELQRELKSRSYWGTDSIEVLKLVQNLTNEVSRLCNSYQNCFGGKVKFGFSSPNYMSRGKQCKATFDGRNDGEPLAVHISSKGAIPYTELLNFASKQSYNAANCNGSVVDFFVTPSFIENNFKKFFMLIKVAINMGFFEMQMNVLSSEMLIEAKKNPEKYENLIVRVWGFSAYFNDLPVEYQDVLIQRAIDSEKERYYGNESFS
ncbi:MAG: hypothetical protein IKL49_09925 [Lachnospiraceae bacterium]|nr:hypothetical protein [Lachnospiraceae bacterium]